MDRLVDPIHPLDAVWYQTHRQAGVRITPAFYDDQGLFAEDLEMFNSYVEEKNLGEADRTLEALWVRALDRDPARLERAFKFYAAQRRRISGLQALSDFSRRIDGNPLEAILDITVIKPPLLHLRPKEPVARLSAWVVDGVEEFFEREEERRYGPGSAYIPNTREFGGQETVRIYGSRGREKEILLDVAPQHPLHKSDVRSAILLRDLGEYFLLVNELNGNARTGPAAR